MKSMLTVLLTLMISTAALASGEEKVRTRIVVVDAGNGEVLIGAAVKLEGIPEVFYTDPDGVVEVMVTANENTKISISYISFLDLEMPLSQIADSGVIALASY